jgi:hypothetical protein
MGLLQSGLSAVLVGAVGMLLGGRADAEELDADTLLGAPVTYRNLTFFPLVAKADEPAGAGYTVLDEGLRDGSIKVVEKGDGQVNTLTIQNQSKRPLFVLAGEVVIGGKQDRIIGKDALIQSGETVDMQVFCVEHGRWTEAGDGKRFRSAQTVASSKIRKQAAFKDNQGKVWEKVAEKNAQRGVANATGTYRDVATGDKVAGTVQPYAEHLEPALAAPRTVGVAVALNGRVVGVEQFGSPALFAKLRAKLVRSYYVDAVDEPEVKDARLPTAADLRAFIDRAGGGKESVVVAHKSARTTRVQAGGVVGAKVVDEAAASPAAGPAKPVYKTVQTEE